MAEGARIISDHSPYRRVSVGDVSGAEAVKEMLTVVIPPPTGERVVAATWTDAAGVEHVVRFDHDADGTPMLAWHYGPTADDPDPGRMWHHGCGGEVLSFDGVRGCMRCDQQEDDGDAG